MKHFFNDQVIWAWSSLLQGRELLIKGIRWQVGNGSNILFWEDKWIPAAKDFKVHMARPPDCHLISVLDFINPHSKSWNEDELRKWISKDEVISILSIPISHIGKNDTLVWHFDSKGHYTVKSGYHLARELQSNDALPKASSSFQPPQDVWKFIWNINISKLKHFWWKACCNFIATKENLHHRRCHPSPMCPICSKEPESIEHLLFRCEWTTKAWFGSPLNYKVDSNSIPSVMKWTVSVMESLNSAKDRSDCLGKCIFLAWQIWKSRNDWVFNHVPVDPRETITRAAKAWEEFILNQSTQNLHRNLNISPQANPCWSPPAPGYLKINCDVAKHKKDPKVTIAAIVRDDKGNLIGGRVARSYASSVLQGEALAVRLAGALMGSFNCPNFIIESDSKVLIKLCSTETVPPWECSAIIDDIRSFASSSKCVFSWVNRNSNRVAHWVASHFYNSVISHDWVFNPHPLLSQICKLDIPLEVLEQ